MGGLGKLTKAVVSGVVAMACAVLLVTALTVSDADAAACALSIPTCGCTINSPGSYTLTGTSPMNSTGTCIDITASDVTLVGASKTIKGPGSTSTTFGVHVEPAAHKVVLEDIIVEDFGQGFRFDGPNTSAFEIETEGNNKGFVVNGANTYLIEAFSILDNLVGFQVNSTATDFVMVAGTAAEAAGTGIKLNGVSGAFLSDVAAVENGTFGIWLKSASDNTIIGFESETNGVAGVYLGCNPAGPNGTACPAGVPSSNGNSINGDINPSSGSTDSIVTNTKTPPFNQLFGVAVGLGNLHNHFLLIEGSGNATDDALDENPNCGSNRWFADSFSKTSPLPNITLTCLN